ncbi:NAC domain-containing protein 78-like [Coffea arabica]|uniref:NAC domain-containing protein 78-like n=1 Tax=Coffea arabica TaxID=13443 RepID=A0A6P6VSH6_COFAR
MFSKTSTSLAPGFRFHPTDEELVRYYLRRKLCGKPFRLDAISEIDIYKAEPWELPGKSRLKTRDLEWYFFSVLDKKYGNGSRTNRATEEGYWKTTGKDRPVRHKSQVVGMKKTLVYHSGRAPKGQRTNWVMHEYRLIDEELEKAGIVQDAFVLCRVFQKSGSGPKNGEQYGAPFVEEEWEEDELEMVPKEEAAEEVEVGDDSYWDGIDLDQILGTEIPPDNDHMSLNVVAGENVASVEENTDSSNDPQKLLVSNLPLEFYSGENVRGGEETTGSNNDSQNHLVGAGEYNCVPEQSDDQNSYNLPVHYDLHQKAVKREYIGEPSNALDAENVNYLLDEPYMDALDNLQFDDGAFLETNDLSNPIAADASAFGMLEEYLNFYDADGEIPPYMNHDLPEMMGINETLVSGQASILPKESEEKAQSAEESSEKLLGRGDVASSSKEEPTKEYFQYPFIKQASRMLGSIPAPPAFASDFPSEDATLLLDPSSSSTAHVTAGMIQIGNIGPGSHGMDWLFGKHGRYNVVLSFGLSRGDDNSTTLESVVSIRPGKAAASGMSRGWFCFIFFWVLVLSVGFKIGTCICAR